MIDVSLLDDNLRPFLTAAGWLVGHDFDEDDWLAIEAGIAGTDAEVDRWYAYEFCGGRRTPFSVAYDASGGSIVQFRADLPGEFADRLRLLGEFCGHFRWHTTGPA